MQIEQKNQMIGWASKHNLNYLIKFHNNVRGLLKDKFKELKENDLNGKEKNFSAEVLRDYDRILHINTFLMLYSFLEEWLYLLWQVFVPAAELCGKHGSIGRFKNIVTQLGVNVSQHDWQILMDAEELRNCLLHSNGRVSLAKNQKKIKIVIGKKDLKLEIVNDRILITGEYLEIFCENIVRIMEIGSTSTLNSQLTEEIQNRHK